jgi:hypothetical protein
MRQQSYVTSAVFLDERFEASSEEPLEGLALYKLVAEERDTEMFTLALASDDALPEMPSLATMTSHVGLREWVAASQVQEQALRDHRRYIQELETKVADRSQLQHRLIETEQQLTTMPALQLRLEELERANAELSRSAEELQATKASFSWRITKPLREGKGFLRRFLRGDAT